MKLSNILFFALVAVLGFIVIAGAPMLTGHSFSVRMGVKHFSWSSAIGLVLLGFFAGCFKPGMPWLWAAASVCILPVLAIVEMFQDPTSHNLWPLEFGFYGFMSLLTAAGAYFGGLTILAARRSTQKR